MLGVTFFDIPIEELFFFVIQTYNTSFLYFICSKPTFHVIYLQGKDGDRRLRAIKWAGAALIVGTMAFVESVAQFERQASYMHLILVWAGPFLFMLWYSSYSCRSTTTNSSEATLLPVPGSTALVKHPLSHCVADGLSLGRGYHSTQARHVDHSAGDEAELADLARPGY